MFGRVAEAPLSALNPLVDCAKFLEGLETHYDASTTHTVVETRRNADTTHIPRFKPSSVGGTIFNTVHLERPPGTFFVSLEPPAFEPGDVAPKLSHEKVKGLLPNVANLSVGCVKYFEGAETHDGEWVVPFLLLSRSGPFLAIWTLTMLDTFCDPLDVLSNVVGGRRHRCQVSLIALVDYMLLQVISFLGVHTLRVLRLEKAEIQRKN